MRYFEKQSLHFRNVRKAIDKGILTEGKLNKPIEALKKNIRKTENDLYLQELIRNTNKGTMKRLGSKEVEAKGKFLDAAVLRNMLKNQPSKARTRLGISGYEHELKTTGF